MHSHEGSIHVPAQSTPNVSTLMSTYHGEKASNLDKSLQSIASQILRPDEIVLVIDGPIGSDQEDLITRFKVSNPDLPLKIVRLAKSVGLALAMNAGLAECAGEYIMRMDSDDLCEPDRLQIQIAYAAANPETDIISSWSEEFFEDGNVSQVKVAPVSHEAVISALKWRNVLVHPTILVKTDLLRDLGGYRSTYGKLEDYDLFVRMALVGARFHVIPKVLVRVRSSIEQRGRRGGLGYCLNEIRFRADCLHSGFLSVREFLFIAGLSIPFRLASGSARRRIYSLARVRGATG